MKKEVFIVTHGDKWPGIDPGMTEQGFAQIAALKPLLPTRIELAVVGTGQRHQDVYSALDLKLVKTVWTPLVGGPESLAKLDEGNLVILANGQDVPLESYTFTRDGSASMLELLKNAPDNTVICSGRPAMEMLGMMNAKSACVYKIVMDDDPNNTDNRSIIAIEELVGPGVSWVKVH